MIMRLETGVSISTPDPVECQREARLDCHLMVGAMIDRPAENFTLMHLVMSQQRPEHKK